MNPVEHIEIGLTGPGRFLGVKHRLAQQIERGRELAAVEVVERGDRFVNGFTRDESRCELAGHPVFSNEPKDARLLAQPQEGGFQHQP